MSLINRPITEDPVHIIYRLAGSLPQTLLRQLRREYAQVQAEAHKELSTLHSEDSAGRAIVRQAFDERLSQIQLKYDHYLDRVITGPDFLVHPQITQIVIDSWLFLEKHFSLVIDAISVMPNHVHIQLSTTRHDILVDSKKLMISHRKWTTRLINQVKNTTDEKVWATPFFDRDVRRNAFGTVFWYILENPVKAGLCLDFQAWSGNYWRTDLMD